MSLNQYKHPTSSIVSRPLSWLCNNALLRLIRRSILSRLPFLQLQSDVTDIVYLNWLVDISRVKHLYPDNMTLLNINEKTVFTILTYQHEHFCPNIFKPIKVLFPSPLQSNWRLYPKTIDGKLVNNAVFFIKNCMDSLLFSVGTRLFSDAMFTHYPLHFLHQKSENTYHTTILSGASNSPDLNCECEITNNLSLPDELIAQFGTQESALAYLCLQKTAYTEVFDAAGLCEANISLPIIIEDITPLSVTKLKSDWLTEIIQDAAPFAFAVPAVHFEILSERIVSFS